MASAFKATEPLQTLNKLTLQKARALGFKAQRSVWKRKAKTSTRQEEEAAVDGTLLPSIPFTP